MSDGRPKHIEGFLDNLKNVSRLIEIHEQVAGSHPGYKAKVEVLNKSGIVLLVACWEAFIEDLASSAFEFVLREAKEPSAFPNTVLVTASDPLRKSKDERAVWQLAGDGWLAILTSHKKRTIEKYLYRFSNPNAKQIDDLFKDLLDFKSVSSYWHWQRMSAASATKSLSRLVELRGSIAHRVTSRSKVYKVTVTEYIDFIYRIAVITHNRVARRLYTLTGKKAWGMYRFRTTS
jgi:hypothetical protein